MVCSRDLFAGEGGEEEKWPASCRARELILSRGLVVGLAGAGGECWVRATVTNSCLHGAAWER
jgi:hypothetical protein